MGKIALIIGTRPNLIKATALKIPGMFVINTGQHYEEMNDLYERVKVKYNLNVGSKSQGKQVAEMISKIEDILLEEKPDLVLVIGDTNSTLAGAIAASKLSTSLGHIEAGMRSYDNIPEEKNRKIVDHLSNYLFCSTSKAVTNLRKEGITQGVYHTGDLMADLVKGTRKPKGYVMATIHRPYNTDDEFKLREIVQGFQRYPKLIWPIHPRTAKMIKQFKIDTTGLDIRPPASFKEMLKLELGADLIITDSGGVQRDAYLLSVPSIILRECNEWEELTGDNPGLLGKDVGKEIRRICEGIINN